MRLLLFIALIFAIYYALRNIWGLLPGTGRQDRHSSKGKNRGEVVDELVKDPVCGVYVPRRQAVRLKDRDKTLYFCSDECKKRYLDRGV